MHWRDLLERLRPAPAPLPALVQASATRTGEVDRRAFLHLCGAAVAGMALDPERLLWVPGPVVTVATPAETIIVSGGHMWVTPEWYIRKSIEHLQRHIDAKGLKRVFDPNFKAAPLALRPSGPRPRHALHD